MQSQPHQRSIHRSSEANSARYHRDQQCTEIMTKGGIAMEFVVIVPSSVNTWAAIHLLNIQFLILSKSAVQFEEHLSLSLETCLIRSFGFCIVWC